MIRLYSHGGSGNHGCEALVRSTAKILKSSGLAKDGIVLYSYAPEEDKKYISEGIFDAIVPVSYRRSGIRYLFHALMYKAGWNDSITALQHKDLFKDVKKGDICLCMGGDTYTYDGWPEVLAYVNKRLRKKGAKTVLWGCSLSDDLFQKECFINDIKSYDLITVRERLTYEMLQSAGVKDNVQLVSDPAFELDTAPSSPNKCLPGEKDAVGINLSPLIMSCEASENIVLKNYMQLIDYILSSTDFNIALIPHVVWNGNDDRDAISKLKMAFPSHRVMVIDDDNCCVLKGIISQCRFFIGARTHSTIAAYSHCIPTLVAGYSVKALGIAESLFGTSEGYVLPVQSLKNEYELLEAFKSLMMQENNIRTLLNEIMPEYQRHCYDGIDAIKKL